MYRFDDARPIALQDFIEEITDLTQWKSSASVLSYVEKIKVGFRKYLGQGYYVDTFTIKKRKAQ